MTLTLKIPDEIEQRLRQQADDVGDMLTESALADLYRNGRITHAELGRALGLSRFEVDAVIKRHKAGQELSIEELRRDATALPNPRIREDRNGDRSQ